MTVSISSIVVYWFCELKITIANVLARWQHDTHANKRRFVTSLTMVCFARSFYLRACCEQVLFLAVSVSVRLSVRTKSRKLLIRN